MKALRFKIGDKVQFSHWNGWRNVWEDATILSIDPDVGGKSGYVLEYINGFSRPEKIRIPDDRRRLLTKTEVKAKQDHRENIRRDRQSSKSKERMKRMEHYRGDLANKIFDALAEKGYVLASNQGKTENAIYDVLSAEGVRGVWLD